MSIVAICGLQGAGKDTLASCLIENFGFTKLSFSSTLKDAVSSIFGWNRDLLEGISEESRVFRETIDDWWTEKLQMTITPRIVLQKIGTDVFRTHFHQNIWVLSLEKKLMKSHGRIVVTDCRFPNEIEMLKRMGATVVHIYRGEFPAWFVEYDQNGTIPSPEIHSSEYAWIKTNFDMVVENNFEDKSELLPFCKYLVS